MKRNNIIIGILFALLSTQVLAQNREHKVSLKGNAGEQKISFMHMAAKLSIKSHAANEVVIKSDRKPSIPERAQGLKPLSNNGPDNTNLGLNVTYENGEVKVLGAGKIAMKGSYEILIPKNMNIYINYDSFNAKDIEIDGIGGEIEIKANSSHLDLRGITGPVVLHTLNKDISIKYGNVSQVGPSSISSINGDIDISMDGDTSADFKFSTINGEIYTDFDLNLGGDKNLTRIGGGMKATAVNNGGGVRFGIETINGNVYLRKSK